MAVTRGTDPTDQALRRSLAPSLAALPACHAHVDPARLFAHAAEELSPSEARAVDRHLLACADGRCRSILRDAVTGASAARDALYGVRRDEHTDGSVGAPRRQSARSVDCDPSLWELFESLAREEGCSTDWLVNEAMRGYLARAQQRPRPIPPRDVTVRDAPPSRDYPRDRNTPTLQRAYLPKAPPSSRRSPAPPPVAAPAAPRLSVVIEGVLHEVNKDRFVVGRGSRASDLAIDDPGVSRQHALIEHAGDSYYLVDMGSTNGIEYQGQRIERRRIAHGDRFRICDHELEFLMR